MKVIRLDQLNREQFQEDEGKVVKSDAGAIELPSVELTYPPKKEKGSWEDDFPFSQVGQVSSLEDNHIDRIGLAYLACVCFCWWFFYRFYWMHHHFPPAFGEYCVSPNSVVTLGVLTVIVKNRGG